MPENAYAYAGVSGEARTGHWRSNASVHFKMNQKVKLHPKDAPDEYEPWVF